MVHRAEGVVAPEESPGLSFDRGERHAFVWENAASEVGDAVAHKHSGPRRLCGDHAAAAQELAIFERGSHLPHESAVRGA